MLQARTRLNIPHCFIEQVEELCNIFVVVQIVGHSRRGVGLAACTARWEGLRQRNGALRLAESRPMGGVMVAIDPARRERRRRGNPVVVVDAFAARALRSAQLLSSVDTRQSDSTRPRQSLLLLDITYERRVATMRTRR